MTVPAQGPLRLSGLRRELEVENLTSYGAQGNQGYPVQSFDDALNADINAPWQEDPGPWSGGEEFGPHALARMEDPLQTEFVHPVTNLNYDIEPINWWVNPKPSTTSLPGVNSGESFAASQPAGMDEWRGFNADQPPPSVPVPGCTDPEATNFNCAPGVEPFGGLSYCLDFQNASAGYGNDFGSAVTVDDGSCDSPGSDWSDAYEIVLESIVIQEGPDEDVTGNVCGQIGLDFQVQITDIDYDYPRGNLSTDFSDCGHPDRQSDFRGSFPVYQIQSGNGSGLLDWNDETYGWITSIRMISVPDELSLPGNQSDPILWSNSSSNGLFDLYEFWVEQMGEGTYPYISMFCTSFLSTSANGDFENADSLFCGFNFDTYSYALQISQTNHHVYRQAKILWDFTWAGEEDQMVMQWFWYNYINHGGDNGGCLEFGTKILMSDGTHKNVEEIEPEDDILSVQLEATQHKWEKTGRINWVNEGKPLIKNKVTSVRYGTSPDKLIINEKINATGEHPFFIRRGHDYMWSKANSLVMSDYLVAYNLKTNKKILEPIKSIKKEFGTTNIVAISCQFRNYIANGYVVHNK